MVLPEPVKPFSPIDMHQLKLRATASIERSVREGGTSDEY